MIGAGDTEHPLFDGPPQGLAMAGRPIGRAHHMAGGDIEVGVGIDGCVDGEETRQGFADDPDAAGLGASDGFGGFGGGDMHHIERNIQYFRHGDGASGSFALALGGPGKGMALRSDEAFRPQLRLQMGDQFAVFGMHLG